MNAEKMKINPEQPKVNNNENLPMKRKRSDRDKFFAIRHSKAEYKLNENIVQSENPEGWSDPKKQDFLSDLSPEGKELAEKKANEFFAGLDPKKDALFFASSDLVRAAETAKIYKDVAEKLGFKIIKPEHVRDDLVEKIGGGDIRKLDALSLDIDNMLLQFIFNPDKDYLKEVVKHPENISKETLDNWGKARSIIENNNKGSWGANYAAHSKEIKKLFPNIKTTEDLYNQKFKNMMRLMNFAQDKIKETNPKKNIKVLAFSHENAFLYFLDKNFKEGGLNNCESVGFKVSDKGTTAEIRGESKKIEI